MSWLFGVKKQPMPMPESSEGNAGSPGAGSSSGDQQLSKAEKKAMEAYRFDSSALERAAAAAKTLETSSKCIGLLCNLECFPCNFESTFHQLSFYRKCKRSIRAIKTARSHKTK